jgi:lipoprotein-releasing system permease protein
MFELSVAFRFLKEGKIQTILILVGISVGVAVQIFLSALIGGLQDDLINKTVGAAPHIVASQPDKFPAPLLADSVPVITRVVTSQSAVQPIRNWSPVFQQLRTTSWFTVVLPIADGPAVASRGEQNLPVIVRGMAVATADSLYQISRRLTEGSIRLAANSVLIGSEIAKTLRVKAGSVIRLSTSKGTQDMFTVAGIFDLESKPVNESWIIMPLSRAQFFLATDGGITSIELQVPKVFDAQRISASLAASFPKLKWVSWQENNANLLAALKSQSGSSNLIQVLVLLAVTLGIASVLAVSAIQKARQIGILKAIGATNPGISRIFLIMGAVLGFGGSILGCFAGYGLITGFLAGTAAATGRPLFPLSISPSLYAISIAIATVAGTLAAFIPARRSSRLNPIEVIRNG